MRILKKILLTSFLAIVLSSLPQYATAQERKGGSGNVPIKFGTLPVIQALPIFVASEKGFFGEQGIEVELVPFNSALEKDVALTVGEISGYFGDMMTPMVLRANGVPVRIVATNFNTPEKRRMFAILASPKSSKKALGDLGEAGIAVSSNTIIEYITTKILIARGFEMDSVNLIETKNIPIRFQMLVSSQVPAATLPEPLVTLAEMKGARIAADDAGKGISATILAFRTDYLEKGADRVRGFHAAIDKAVSFISEYPEKARPIMVRHCRIPKPLQQNFAIPKYPRLSLPNRAQVMDVFRWLRQKGIIKSEMTYKEMVSDGFLH